MLEVSIEDKDAALTLLWLPSANGWSILAAPTKRWPHRRDIGKGGNGACFQCLGNARCLSRNRGMKLAAMLPST
jgi:hypothetical protein